MDIKLKLNKDFERCLKDLQFQYGEEFEKINGLHESQLDFSDFINNFIDNDTVADASVDASSNVHNKDIVTLRSEMSKPHEKLLAYNKIFYEMKKEYGLATAKEWFELEWNKALYLHDANSSTFVPYSYKGTETVVVKYKNRMYLTTFEDLFDLVEEKVELLNEQDKAYCKYTNDLYVWDENDCWSKVYRVIRKPKTKDFHWIKSANGLSEIVTSNHPVITVNGDKKASDIIPNEDKIKTQEFNQDYFGDIKEIYCTDIFDEITFKGKIYDGEPLENKEGQVCSFTKYKGRRGSNPIQNKIILDYDFGWMIGMVLAEGSFNHSVCIFQNDNEYLQKAIEVCENKNWGYAVYKGENNALRLQLQSELLGEVFKLFIFGNTAWTKRLAPSIMNYNRDFIKGIVAGVIDGDGTCTSAQGRRIHIRITSRSLVNQLAFLMRAFGYTVREQTPSLYCRDDSFKGKHLIYHMAFTPTQENEDFNSIKISTHRIAVPYEREVRQSINKRYSFGYGEQIVLNNEILIDDNDEYVYDISVETGHFMCNNIVSHNCFAYDLKRIVEEGLFYLEDHNKPEPAKHLETFVDFVKEFINFATNRTSGACGLPNLIPYMWWFWRNDVDSGHYSRNQTPEQFAKSEIQRIIYGMNQPYTRDGIQSAFVNSSIFDSEYFDALFGGMEYPDGKLAIDYKEEIFIFQKWFLEEMSGIKDRGRMFTFPVNTISLLYKDGKFVDEDFAKWASNHNRKWNDSNFFCDKDVTSLSNCCRLKSNISDLGYFNSIGGTALKVGSVKVSTINLARIAYEANNDEKKYLKILKKRLILDMKLLHVIRHIIQRNVDKGLLPNFVDGIIDFEHLYNTIGINGIYETMKTFGYTKCDKDFETVSYKKEAFDFGEKIFKTIHNTIDEFVNGKEYKVNCEQVPGETAAVKFLEADKILFPEIVVKDLPLYGNQWIPLGIHSSLKDRIKICSQFDQYCNGGSICHINLDAPFSTEEQAWDMLNYVTGEGVTYFAFNGKMSSDDNGHLFYGNICPECGSEKTAEYTRTVG